MAQKRMIERKQNLNPQERKQMTLENHDAIEENAKAIKTNHRIIIILMVVIFTLIGGLTYMVYKQHTLETCQAELFTHLTGQDAPDTEELNACGGE